MYRKINYSGQTMKKLILVITELEQRKEKIISFEIVAWEGSEE